MLLEATTLSGLDRLWLWLNFHDQTLFIYINRIWTNPVLDSFFPIWRESTSWAPLYLFLLIFSLMNFGLKAWPWILFIIITATLTDQISSTFFKDWFGRLRPCSDPNFSQYVRLLLNRCPGSGSFTSSHATSHFGAAMFISITWKKYINNWRYLFFVWAFTISYGQVYIGVHYPLDIIGGAALGCLIGYGTGTFFNKKIGISLIDEAPEKQPVRL